MPKVILCHGVFDLVHPGHLEHLRQAKAMGDHLVVSITADRYVAKGPGRPLFTQKQRAAFLRALQPVDETYIVDDPTALPAIQYYQPSIYCKGPEYRNRQDGAFAQERAAVEAYGGEVRFTEGFTASSTSLINGYVPVLDREPQEYIQSFKAKYTLEGVNHWLDQMAGLKALVMGERITDCYHYLEPLGKSPKDSLISWQPIRTEQWDGGSAIIQEHLRGLGLDVSLDFGDNPPVVKRRYLWGPQQTKIFAIIDPPNIRPFHRAILEAPLSVVADFGHGMFTDISASLVARCSEFLALTCQTNSSNWGYNLLSKWPRADYIVADEEELRLTRHEKRWPLEDLIETEAQRMGAKIFVVTQGHKGCLIWDGKECRHVPALADRVADRLGAGDAFYAATAPLAFLGAPAEIIGLIGNLAGAIEVGAIGQKVLQRDELKKWLKGILL